MLTGILVLASTGCGNQSAETAAVSQTETEIETTAEPEAESEDEEWIDREIDVCLNSYDENGGMISITETNFDGSSETFEFGLLGILAAEGETIGSALDFSGYSDIAPVSSDYTFEGWLEYVDVQSVDEDGFDTFHYELLTDKMYTTEQLLALTIPDHGVNYVAKWAEIPVEEYFHDDVWENAESSGAFAFYANGGTMTFFSYTGNELESDNYTYWLDEGMALNDVMGTEYWDALIDITKDGAEFTGWTLYQGDSAFWNSEETNEDDITNFLFDPDDEDTRYLLLRNAEVIRELASSEELCGISLEPGKCYFAEANWK